MDHEAPNHSTQESHHKPRRRKVGRRLRSKRPISAHLVLDHHLRGDVGVLSDDLIKDLLPTIDLHADGIDSKIFHVAICPWSPHTSAVEDLAWTIIPIRVQSIDRSQAAPLSHSTVQFPAAASSLQSFIRALEALDPTRHHGVHSQRAIEIRVVDVAPIRLDTVYVTVEKHLLRDLDEIQSQFGGGFSTGANAGRWTTGKGTTGSTYDSGNKKRPKKTAAEVEERLTAAVREALSAQRVLHAGDIISLPLPSHPITHVPPPPARITFCEPVSQGLLMPKTRVVLVQARSSQSRSLASLQQKGRNLLKNVLEDEADDTSNEQFYSAAEDKPVESSTDIESVSPLGESETDDSSHSLSDVSDDSLDDMISLAAPELPPQPAGSMSAMTATPRAGGWRGDGVMSPGSVVSNFTSRTMRPGKAPGKVFRAEGLLNRVSIDALHPKPREDDDVDSFVFVDVTTLAKLGCFSGDWIRIEATEEPQLNMLSSLKFGSLNGLPGEEEDEGNWRVTKVFGISGISSPKPRYPVNKSSMQRPNMNQLPATQRLTPTILVPPILLNNLESPKYVKLSPLAKPPSHPSLAHAGLSHSKPSIPKSPPVAKEVTLLKISTPLSMDRSLQPALFASLKRYFESKRRLLKSGDLVGISVDIGLGKAIFTSSRSTDGGSQDDDITTKLGFSADIPQNEGSVARKVGAAWFRVGQVVPNSPEEGDGEWEHERWGGVAIIDTICTRMVQAGSEISTVPGTLGSNWEYWLGVKTVPKPIGELPSSHGIATDPPKTFMPPLQTRLRELLSAATSPRAIQLGMKPVVILLTSTQRNIGKATIATRACTDIGLHTFPIDAYDILAADGAGANGGDVKTEAFLKARAERAFGCGSNCTALLIQHIEVLTADRMITALKEIVADSRVLIATTTDIEKVPEGIRSLFTHEMEMTAPEEKEREGILHNAVADRSVKISADVDLANVAVKTAALVSGDLVDVVERAVAARDFRLENLAQKASSYDKESPVTIRDIILSGGDAARCVTKADFDAAVDAARKNFADSIGAPKIPNVSWDDVGGLTNVKDAVMETIQLPLERPELFAKGMKKRSGILFYGPPGTGKTLLAKAIATEFSLNFFSVKGPELLNMYIGESEANVRRVFQRARDARPCVVFFDELDSVAPKRGNQGDSGGVMDRIVSQLLAELDGMSNGDENGGGVFVIGATNRPDLLDAALLRPGRFDKMLYLGISDTHEKQSTILEALTRKFALHPDLSLQRVSEQLPFTYTGADLYALCSDAMLKAITRQATAVDEKIKQLPGGPVSTAYYFDHLATPEDVAVMVTEEDFIAAKSELVASVSAKELEHFERVRRTFESVDLSATDKDAKSTAEPTARTIADAINDANAYGHTFIDGVETSANSNHTDHTIHAGKQKRTVSSHSIASGKGKGKGKGKGATRKHTSGQELENGYYDDTSEAVDGEDMADNDDDEYIIRTDHLGTTSQ